MTSYTAEELRKAASLVRELNVTAGSNVLADKLDLQAIEAERLLEHQELRKAIGTIIFAETCEDRITSEQVADDIMRFLVDNHYIGDKTYHSLKDVPANMVVRDTEGEYWFHENQKWYMTFRKDEETVKDRNYYSDRDDAESFTPFYATEWKIV